MNRRVHMVYIGGHLVQMFALGEFLSNVAGTALSDCLTDQSIVSTAIPVIVSDFNA